MKVRHHPLCQRLLCIELQVLLLHSINNIDRNFLRDNIVQKQALLNNGNNLLLTNKLQSMTTLFLQSQRIYPSSSHRLKGQATGTYAHRTSKGMEGCCSYCEGKKALLFFVLL